MCLLPLQNHHAFNPAGQQQRTKVAVESQGVPDDKNGAGRFASAVANRVAKNFDEESWWLRLKRSTASIRENRQAVALVAG